MQKLGLNQLREMYLKFFEGKGHLRLPSFSLIPQNDPSLLLINAGMAPLKRYFTGEEEPPRRRVTTCQKCVRTADIDKVGKTARHGTFFEMLGNFSFGDYFKKEAISWAWEFVTRDLKIPPERLWVSIYEEDDEAFEIWNREVGVPAEKIVRLGKEDNFWEHGMGPCGPCSEIYFDRGPDKGCGSPDCKVGCDCDRYVEFWNLVFTQFNKEKDGTYTRLKNPNIDTGMGLERLACIMQGVDSLFEVDTIRRILDSVCEVAGVKYGEREKSDISIRLITDHIRSTVMMVCDGVIPSNEGRGYVLRRLLRRAARHGKLLGIDRPFLYDIAQVAIEESKEAYPELAEKAEYIRKVIRIEEEKFQFTIDQGISILNSFMDEVKASGGKVIPGDVVFKLHDTYGFPLDLTREIGEENGLEVDEEGFRRLMDEQRQKAREALKERGGAAWGDEKDLLADKSLGSEFVGYEEIESEARIIALIKDDSLADHAQEGDRVAILLDRTPFYAESGGQVGDTGYISSKDGVIRVEDCQKTADGKHLHIGAVEKGLVEKGDAVKAAVDAERRMDIARNHTATHLLHKALRDVLGSHVAQAGSLVSPDRLRFDFSHFAALSPEELKKIEDQVNRKILESVPVRAETMALEEARRQGAMALFGEKYGDRVRVVGIDDYSMELCGGTHLTNTSQAGLFKILSEGSVASGVRRIEAITGREVLRFLREKEEVLGSVAAVLKAAPQDCVKKAEALNKSLKEAEKELERLKAKLVSAEMGNLMEGVTEVKGLKVLAARLDQLDMEGLRTTADTLKGRIGNGVVVLASSYGEKVSFVAAAAGDAVSKGVHAGNLVREIARIAGGGGGGRPDMAQAGGKDLSKIDEALKKVKELVELQVKS